jgi:hypothetical protein
MDKVLKVETSIDE